MTIVIQSMVPDESTEDRRERAEWTEIVSRDDEADAWDRAWQVLEKRGFGAAEEHCDGIRSRARRIRTTERGMWFLRVYA
jgi:hypothetical protein